MQEASLSENPLHQFEAWLEDARARAGLEFPNAMSLATCDEKGRSSVRMVLLKGVSSRGFIFFTNYESRKAMDLARNPQASLCFYWEKTNRSVRVEGRTEKISREESREYFDSRPRESRIGAWASPQSKTIASRQELEAKVKDAEEKFREQEKIPLPPHWGGYCLIPDAVEFWVNGPNRLHDRILYRSDGKSGWKKSRLAP